MLVRMERTGHMKRDYAVNLFLVLTLSSIALYSATPTRKRPWLGVLFEPKEKSNREHKLNLNEGTILCLLDRQMGNLGL